MTTTSDEDIKIREELIAFQGAIADLQKWKIIAIASAFAAGLGLSGTTGSTTVLALLAIPIVTFYTDLTIKDYHVRVCVIANFLRYGIGEFARYEVYVQGTAQNIQGLWLFGEVALSFASIVANGAIIAIGCFAANVGLRLHHGIAVALIIAGALGVVSVAIIQVAYFSVFRKLANYRAAPSRPAA